VFHLKKLYIGNLPYSFNDEDLANVFADYGEVASSTVITDRDSGRSKGFGFVELEDDKMADKAIKELDGTEVEGRNLKISEARPKREAY
jgi:RNA recognition motif-containing protein